CRRVSRESGVASSEGGFDSTVPLLCERPHQIKPPPPYTRNCHLRGALSHHTALALSDARARGQPNAASPMNPSSFRFLLLVLLLGATSARAASSRPPNFLFIYTDDQRWDAMSVVQREQGERARFPWFQTPNMDRLAAEGVRFRNMFVVSSLCAPSRAAFM